LATTVVDLAGRKAHWAKKFLAQHFPLIAPLPSPPRAPRNPPITLNL
jgi:hypothetical protein